ncbi:radical SAM protein [Candidatus Desantisbacteria bacterium CG_4_10_14_0_8_um_filter_48_22]|uniref:Radical SAM protein n=1 Tax=Candidatus Desantisbacteria bacterium CG_4_10_14_0_8_um_filter_48_22 TaxID=1974543 RepID=A0A2M7S6H1_9BACT|nr:MAG: radical SAM protein [Candidatus Desantisbacteria bacterium CG02_land_8_20_14_3_00_49_13]PIZ15141.1 MAG: radical SAM protein [Candidatus Desantisbacteria bacterium CG_4_10_14_0_8_um_filter_48_22]
MGTEGFVGNFIKRMTVKEIVKRLPNASKENLIKMTKMAEKLATIPQDREKAVIVREMFEKGHPSLIYALKVLGKLHPNCRNKFAINLVVNHLLIGNGARENFRKKEGFQPPASVLISPSMKCNLRCQGCYAADYVREDDLSLEILDKIVKESKEIGNSFFTILGGEPFMYPHIFEFFGRHPDCYFQAYTNGTLLTDEVMKKLVKLGNVALMFSLEGFEKGTDARRAPGVYKKVMDAMDRAREAGLLFGFSCYVTKNNVEEIVSDEFIDMLVDKGAMIGWYFLCMPVGKNPTTDFMPTPQQRLHLKIRRDYIRDNKPLFIIDFWNDAPFVRGCIAGRQFIHVNSRGDIEPCIFLHYASHNIKTATLKDALKSLFFRFIKKRQPYDENLYLPCTIIDNPQVLREAVEKTLPYPTHEGAADLVNNQDIRGQLDKYASEVRNLYAKVWAEDVKNDMWKTTREETRLKREGKIVD